MSKAYFLVTHGSSDERYQLALKQLGERIYQQIRLDSTHSSTDSNLPILIATGCLESMSIPLHQQIINFAQKCINRGYEKLVILPLFLLPGVHVMNDLPSEINLAKTAIDNGIKWEILPYLGAIADIINLIQTQRNQLPKSSILLAHGSKRIGGNERIENIAKKSNLLTAYWSTLPSLEDVIKELYQKGNREMGIIPYFLFSGGITEAIAQQVENLEKDLTDSKLYLGNTLAESAQLVNLIAEIIK